MTAIAMRARGITKETDRKSGGEVTDMKNKEISDKALENVSGGAEFNFNNNAVDMNLIINNFDIKINTRNVDIDPKINNSIFDTKIINVNGEPNNKILNDNILDKKRIIHNKHK